MLLLRIKVDTFDNSRPDSMVYSADIGHIEIKAYVTVEFWIWIYLNYFPMSMSSFVCDLTMLIHLVSLNFWLSPIIQVPSYLNYGWTDHYLPGIYLVIVCWGGLLVTEVYDSLRGSALVGLLWRVEGYSGLLDLWRRLFPPLSPVRHPAPVLRRVTSQSPPDWATSPVWSGRRTASSKVIHLVLGGTLETNRVKGSVGKLGNEQRSQLKSRWFDTSSLINAQYRSAAVLRSNKPHTPCN